MVGTDDAGVADLAEGELGSAVDAEVFPSVNTGRVAPEDEVAAEEADGPEIARLHAGRPADGEPFMAEIGVFSHLFSAGAVDSTWRYHEV